MNHLKTRQPLWEHQKTGIEEAVKRPAYALFWEMGTGKTNATVQVLRHKYRAAGKVVPTLILCPIIVVENWRREIEANAGSVVTNAVQCLTGTPKNRRKQLATPGKQIFITNIDAVNTKFWIEICQRRWEILVVDEVHKFKDPTADRTKKIIQFADRVPHKYILTGSPILNSAMDIWAEFRILRRDIFPENFYVFRQQYFFDNNSGMPSNKYFPDWRPRPGTKEALRQIISEHSMRVKKSEVLDLPELVRQTVFVDLTPEQRRLYGEMEEAFITYLDGSACVAEIALTKMLRLQQLAVGIVKTETGEVKRVETGKLKALSELLEDLCPQHKVIVWTNFIDTYKDVRLLCAKLKLKFVEIIGSQDAKQRQAGVDAFNTDPSVSVCIANQQAGGVGIGLQAASYAVYYSKTFSLEHDQQSESRNHRGGSEVHEKITRVDIVIRGTIDEEITAALRSKTQLSEFLLALRNKGRQIENQKEAVTDALEIFTGEQA